jgi:hypothetical protein
MLAAAAVLQTGAVPSAESARAWLSCWLRTLGRRLITPRARLARTREPGALVPANGRHSPMTTLRSNRARFHRNEFLALYVMHHIADGGEWGACIRTVVTSLGRINVSSQSCLAPTRFAILGPPCPTKR